MKIKNLILPLLLISLLLITFSYSEINYSGSEFNPQNNELNMTISNSSVNLYQNLTTTLKNIGANWSNFSFVNLNLNDSAILIYNYTNERDIINAYTNEYRDITWNFTANKTGSVNITITLQNLTFENYTLSFIINVTDPIRFTKSASYIHNNSNFNVTLSNLNLDWTNYKEAYIIFDNTKIENQSSLIVNLSNITNYQNINWELKAVDKGNLTVNLSVINLNDESYNYTQTIPVYSLGECNDLNYLVIYSPNDGLFNSLSQIKINTSLTNWASGNYTYFNFYSDKLYLNYSNIINLNVNGSLSVGKTKSIFLYKNISPDIFYFNIYLYKSNFEYCALNPILDYRVSTDDIILNASFNGNIRSCDNLSELYIIDTNFTDSDNSTKWNGYDNLTISFKQNFNETEKNYTLDKNNSRINISDVKCTSNNLLKYDLIFSVNGTSKTKSGEIDLYYPICEDLEITPYYNYISSDLLTYDINNVEKLKIENTNNYSSKYFANYTSINISLNPYITGYNESRYENNSFFPEISNIVNIVFLSNITFNQTYAMLNNKTFNFSVDVTTDYNNFSCVKPLHLYSPNVTVKITADKNNVVNGTNVTLYINATNNGYSATNFKLSLLGTIEAIGCYDGNLLNSQLFETGTSLNTSCIIHTQFMDKTSLSLFGNVTYNTIPANPIWVNDAGNITITLGVNSDDTSGTNSGNSGSSVKNKPVLSSAPSSTPLDTSEKTTSQTKQTNQDTPPKEETKPVLEAPTSILTNEEKISSSKNVKINEMISNGIKRSQSYEYQGKNTVIKNTLKNGNILPQYDVYITVEIPKNVIPNASLIVGDFQIINFDPIIQFHIPKIDSGEELNLNYTINKKLTSDEINSIITIINSSFSKKELETLENKANETSKSIQVTVDVKKDFENKSVYTTNINPIKDLENVKVYLNIPKCLAVHLNELEFENNEYTIIEEDPLIAFSFSEINTPLSLKFKTIKEVDKDCWEQIKVLPIADKIMSKLTKQKSWYYKFWPILFIILSILITPFIQRHTNILKKEEHIGKSWYHKDVLKELEYGFIEGTLFFLIIVNLLEFFGVAYQGLAFIENTLQWAFILFLIYELSITKIIFGKEYKQQDALIILAFFGMIISDVLVAFSTIATEIIDAGNQNTSVIFSFLNYILTYQDTILYMGFYFGLSIIIYLITIDLKKDIQKESLMGVINETGIAQTNFKTIKRFILTFIIYMAFFTLFFKFFVEWFSLALNSVMVVIGVIVYIVIFIKKHHKHYDNENFIYKVGTFGDEFWQKFISYFTTKEKIFLGVTGILVLHLLVDLSNYMIPYLITFGNSPYFLQLANNGILLNHSPIINLLSEILPKHEILISFEIIIIYLLESFAIISFLALPALIWYDIETGHKLTPHRLLNATFISSIALYTLMPLYRINAIIEKNIIGVDLSLLSIFDLKQNFEQILLITLIIFTTVLIISYANKRLNKLIMIVGVIFSQVFFGMYVYYYLISYSKFFIGAISDMIKINHYIIALVFAIFLIIISLFYVIGFLVFFKFLIDSWAEKKLEIHDKHDKVILALVTYIEKIEDITIASNNLKSKGWSDEYIHEAIVESLKIDEKMKGFLFFEKNKSLSRKEVKTELLKAGWNESLIDSIIKKYW